MLIAATSASSVPALADPVPANDASQAVKRYEDLSRQAERTNEEKKRADEEHVAKQAELDRANAEASRAAVVAERARERVASLRGQLDQLTTASFEGVRLNGLSALVGSKSPRDYLNRASGPDAFDCSGLMQWAYEQVGVDIGRTTRSQAQVGRSVPESQLRPGDLIFYYSSQSHVGMYVGYGKVVHAATESEPVKVSDYKSVGDVNGIRRP